jgi:hypothetical protein
MDRITHGPHNAWMHNAQHIRNTFFKFTKTVRFVSWTFCNWTFGNWLFFILDVLYPGRSVTERLVTGRL